MNQAEMVWPRADGMAEIAHNVNRRYRYIKEAGIPYRIRTTVFQFILLITRVSALSSAQQYPLQRTTPKTSIQVGDSEVEEE